MIERLSAARDAVVATEGDVHLGAAPIGLDLTLRYPRDGTRSDATNCLCGVADSLEFKGHGGQLGHLGELADAFHDNDQQIGSAHCRWEAAADPSYAVRIWELES